MLVYVDESGDPGLKCGSGSTAYFTSALVVFHDDEEADEVKARIKLLRQELGWHPRREFKFNSCSKEERISFLKAVQPYDFCYYGIVINKAALWSSSFNDKETFYKRMNRLVFENASSILKDAIVTIDGSGSRAFRRDLRHVISIMSTSFKTTGYAT